MLLTESYKEQNKKLHESNEHYGTSGKMYADVVNQLATSVKSKDILDYGCGKKTLETELGYKIKNYDPCIEGLDNKPRPALIVVCTDVLEHIEPECLDAVLKDLHRVTKKWGVFVVSIAPARKFLDDGRNAHLIQKSQDWWEGKLDMYFTIRESQPLMKDDVKKGFIAVVKVK